MRVLRVYVPSLFLGVALLIGAAIALHRHDSSTATRDHHPPRHCSAAHAIVAGDKWLVAALSGVFAHGSVWTEDNSLVDMAALQLRAAGTEHVFVVGMRDADERPYVAFARANSIRRKLIARGIAPSRLEAVDGGAGYRMVGLVAADHCGE